MAGTIVIIDWRGDALPREPNKLRPSVVVDDQDRFPAEYPSVIVVPLTRDERIVIPTFSERIEPTPENGAPATSWALGNHVSTTSLKRVIKTTSSRITDAQLASLRRRVALTLGFDF
jgi:mRNA-degrading endonuclease toxin of MazEF toxin-antitoxin module